MSRMIKDILIFIIHPSDVFEEVHPREFELGTAAMAIIVYLLSEEGI